MSKFHILQRVYKRIPALIRIQETNSNEGVKQNKSPNSSRIQFLEADLNQEPSFIFHDQHILQQGPMLKSLS